MTSKPGMVSKSYCSDYMQLSYFAIVRDPAHPALARYYITTPLVKTIAFLGTLGLNFLKTS